MAGPRGWNRLQGEHSAGWCGHIGRSDLPSLEHKPICTWIDAPAHIVSGNISIYRCKNTLYSSMESHTTLLLAKELILQERSSTTGSPP